MELLRFPCIISAIRRWCIGMTRSIIPLLLKCAAAAFALTPVVLWLAMPQTPGQARGPITVDAAPVQHRPVRVILSGPGTVPPAESR